MGQVKDWSIMTEEDKYEEWSKYYEDWFGRTFNPLLEYVAYCNRWDYFYGVSNA